MVDVQHAPAELSNRTQDAREPRQLLERPNLSPWVEPETTKSVSDWAELETIDLTLLDSQDPDVRATLLKQTKKALSVDGFMLVTGLGVSPATIARQLAIAQHLTTGTPREVKERFTAKMSAGSYRGYKLQGIWNKEGGVPDNIEHYNFESESFAHTASQHPETTAPFIPEIEAFAKYTYHHIIRRILTLISLTLELEPDALWKLHDHRSPIGAACQRYMRYTPRDKAEEEATSGIWSKGHTDYNTVSLLFSQPVTALQILTPENDWKWVKHVPGGAVVNVADALEFLSGGVLKATRHRVIRPPDDQAGLVRYVLIHFARAKLDVRLDPIWESPVVKREGKHAFQNRIDSGEPAPTQGEWLEERIRRTGKEQYDEKKNPTGSGLVRENILGRTVEYYV
ncbi:hypothetical protein FFLO_04955 [Filobasidium floriforme]|uniref:Flavonol synthase n=1 Tax=Filobasidium floriforme TaxID=5210 RepID=A0A8K0JI75_9TREE|nr:hypothetical protein FFLO_04955 [Filobasidium floriforme]